MVKNGSSNIVFDRAYIIYIILYINMWPDLQKGTSSVEIFVTWFVNKPLLKHIKKQFCIHIENYAYIATVCMQNWDVLTMVCLQIRSQMFRQKWSLLQIGSHIYMCVCVYCSHILRVYITNMMQSDCSILNMSANI